MTAGPHDEALTTEQFLERLDRAFAQVYGAALSPTGIQVGRRQVLVLARWFAELKVRNEGSQAIDLQRAQAGEPHSLYVSDAEIERIATLIRRGEWLMYGVPIRVVSMDSWLQLEFA